MRHASGPHTGTPEPNRYLNYYADFTLYQRLELIMDLLTRGRTLAGSDLVMLRYAALPRPPRHKHSSVQRHLTIIVLCGSSGGADLNPQELVAEGVLEHFLPLHVPRQLYRFNAFWARLPESLTRCVQHVNFAEWAARSRVFVPTAVQARKRRRCGIAPRFATAGNNVQTILRGATTG